MRRMRSLMAGVVGVGAVATGAAAQNAVQWRVQDGGNGHWYARTSQVGTWEQARDWAVAEGGVLASVTSPAENAVVASLMSATLDCWIGARKLTGLPWTWADGTPWQYTNWCPGEPCCFDAGLYAFMHFGGCWDDHNQTETLRRGVVEFSSDCNGDGIVDYGQCRDGSLADLNGNNIPDCCETGSPCVVGSYPVQWRVQDGGNGHWYAVIPSQPLGTRTEAVAAASAAGANLVAMETVAEWLFTRSLVNQSDQADGVVGNFWLWTSGYIDSTTGMQWTWGNGTPVSHFAWVPCAPNNPASGTRVIMIAPTGLCAATDTGWDDASSGLWDALESTGYIVEWSADCNNDGVVDYGQILSGQLADTNQNGVPDTCEAPRCPGDVTGNNIVDGIDLAALLAAWGGGKSQFDCDVDNDGVVGGSDLAVVLAGWGACP